MAPIQPRLQMKGHLVTFVEGDGTIDFDSTCAEAKRLAKQDYTALVLLGRDCSDLAWTTRMVFVC
ncbi:Aldolase-type TIM barrel [Penicillium verhagenii]|uniref:Aldolase-type TIM barrel n=1 Tax=Penicillium verhagenii TaxID=1562060 RepID=UPI00254517E8|nr:Aldolase-type TIM barrel [Penicillium verhagenii]KAJ5936906.1 Aldolase-type TIM barrel [Penicillium verhagenii]